MYEFPLYHVLILTLIPDWLVGTVIHYSCQPVYIAIAIARPDAACEHVCWD